VAIGADVTPETAVALMTGALAVATFWLAWEARKARREARRDEERRILRAALAEQLDNLRAWTSRDPMRGEPAVRGLQGAEPRLASIASLLDRLELQPDLVAYLIWLTSAVGDHWGRIELSLSSAWGGTEAWTGGPSPLNDTLASQLTDDWRAMVERLQVLAALAAAEARRRGVDDVAAPHDVAPWSIVPQRPPRWRELMAIAGIQRGEPPFPSDPAFVGVRPAARDRAGDETGARQIGASAATDRPR
jgi:hypothetical protein